MVAHIERQMPTNPFHVMRTKIAVLSVAPFSLGRAFKNSTTHRPAKPKWGSIIPRTGARFESLEPTSPEVDCLGHIKLKSKWSKSSKNRFEKKSGRKTKSNVLSHIMKFIFGSHGAASGGDCPTDEGCRTPYPLPGQLKLYVLSSCDAKFSDIYPRAHPFVDPSESPFNGSIGGSD